MPIKERIQSDLTDAMRAGDTRRREILRLLMSAFISRSDRRITLTDDDVIDILVSGQRSGAKRSRK